MLRLFGQRPDSRDGGTRRELLRVGALSLFGSMTTPRLLRAADSGGATRPGKARSVILFNLLGGPSHQDMFDLKPLAPAEIRGEFRPIATSVPGLQICEHLPRTARLMHKAMPDPFGHARLQRPQPAADHDRLHRRQTRCSSGPSRPIRPTSARSASTSAWGRRRCRARSACPAIRAGGSGASTPASAARVPTAGSSGSQYDPLFARVRADLRPAAQPALLRPGLADGRRRRSRSRTPCPTMTADRLDRRRSLLDRLDDAFERANSSAGVARMDRAPAARVLPC